MDLKERKKEIIEQLDYSNNKIYEYINTDEFKCDFYLKNSIRELECKIRELKEELECINGLKWWRGCNGYYHIYVEVMPKNVKAEDMPWIIEKQNVDHLFIVTNKGTFKVHGYQREFWVEFIQDINGG